MNATIKENHAGNMRKIATNGGEFEHEVPSGKVDSSFIVNKSKNIRRSRAKRVLDILLSLVFMVIFAPICLLVAVLIKLDSPGPVLFRQRRYGANGKTFLIYKFRTMTVMETEGNFTQAKVGDSRVTRIGRVLRSSSLDELPQLANVLMGEMSLVGPRPHAIPMDDAFAPVIENYNDRYLVRPGLTGLAQVTGHRGPTESLSRIRLRVLCDHRYICDWSIWLDFVILARTIFALRGPNAV